MRPDCTLEGLATNHARPCVAKVAKFGSFTGLLNRAFLQQVPLFDHCWGDKAPAIPRASA